MNVLEHYNKANISFGTATPIDDDTYFSRISYNKTPFIIKTNKVCFYKKRNTQYKSSDNYIHISLTSQEYLEWFDNFYHDCIEIFHSSSSNWFEDPMSLSDIEFCFINPLKSNIRNNCFDIACAVDENRIVIVDTNDNIHQLQELSECNIIPSFHIKGIKFNSKNFMFEIELNNLCIILPDDVPSEKNNDEMTEPSTLESMVENTINSSKLNLENKVVKDEISVNNLNNFDNNTVNNTVNNKVNNEINEYNIETDNLDDLDLEIEESGIYEVYEMINEKIKENMVEHIRKIFINKKIKTKLDLCEMVDDQEIEEN
jgi:hypothetical protein